MKITDVRACQPVAAGSPPDWRTSIGQILVAIDTDAGLTGYGVGGGGLAGVHVVQSVIRDRLLGVDPEPVETLWDELYALMLPFGQKGIAVMAQSAVDLALWDLRGKAAHQPLAEWLGGEVGLPLPTYATVWGSLEEELADGHRAFKLHVEGEDPERIVKSVRDAREVLGPEAPVMIDAWMSWNLETTLAVAERLVGLDVDWIEEPLPVHDLDGYAVLAEQSPIPIAGGEHEYTAYGFRPLVERRLHQVLQPDVCWCGGLTELLKVYAMAAEAGLRVCPHRGSEPWSLHAIASVDPDPLAESGRPWMTWVGGSPDIIDGTVTLSDRPGFGVVIDETTLETL